MLVASTTKVSIHERPLCHHFALCQPFILLHETHTLTSVTEANQYYSMNLDSQLIRNAIRGNLNGVHDCLRRGANVNAQSKHFGYTALNYASEKGNLDVVRALLYHEGIDVNIQDDNGETALISASLNGHLDPVRALLNHDEIDVNIKNDDDRTALICASENGHFGVVHALLDHNGIDVSIRDIYGDTILTNASKRGRLEVVRALLHHNGIDVNIKVKYGNTALILASGNGHIEVVLDRKSVV